MGKSKAQGTRWETAIVKKAKAKAELTGSRLPLGSVKNEPDVEVVSIHGFEETIPVVMWKRLTSSNGGQRRSPDGAPEVAVLTVDDLLLLLERACESDAAPPPRLLVQAKAKQALNVTRTLGDLIDTLEKEPF